MPIFPARSQDLAWTFGLPWIESLTLSQKEMRANTDGFLAASERLPVSILPRGDCKAAPNLTLAYILTNLIILRNRNAGINLKTERDFKEGGGLSQRLTRRVFKAVSGL